MKGPAWLALAGVLALLCGGCGGGTAADRSALAAAIREVEQRGADFKLTVTETMTGGDVPNGKYAQQVYTSSGAVIDDNASLVLGTTDPGSGRSTEDFDLVVADSNVFVRPHGTSRDWYTSWTFVAQEFIPGVRLNLVRETALLASRVSKSTSLSNGAFVNQYTITPAADQLHQLMSFSSSGTLTASLAAGSNRLQGINGHFVGTDTSNHRHVVVDSVLTFSSFGRARPVRVPAGGVAVQPADLFSTTAGQ